MYLKWLLGGISAFSALGWILTRRRGARFATPLAISLVSLGLLETLGYLGGWVVESCIALTGVAILQFLCALVNPVFERKKIPRLVYEALLALGYFTILMIFLSRLGLNIAGLVTTSAVATAAIGFAMQDTLANLAAGITLQMEKSVCAGQWIRIPTGVGRVETVRLRHTILESPFGDKVLVPNHLLTKESVVILANTHRLQIPLRVQYGPSPSSIENAVSKALRASPIAHVAKVPLPECLLVGFQPDHVEYAVVVYILQPGVEAIAASESLTRAFHALARINAKLNGFAQTVELLSTAPGEPALVRTGNIELLRRMDLFATLDAQEISTLAACLKAVSFAPGELIIKQGDHDDSLYVIDTGRVEIEVASSSDPPETNRIAELHAGDFFGEMSLFTGEPRAASVVALEEVCCWTLAKTDLMPILQARPGITREISGALSHRKGCLEEALERMNLEALENSQRETAEGLFARMQHFFGLKTTAKSAA